MTTLDCIFYIWTSLVNVLKSFTIGEWTVWGIIFSGCFAGFVFSKFVQSTK